MNSHLLPVSEIQLLLNSHKQGLHHAEAEERRKQFGKNELIEKKGVSILVILLYQFKDVMVIILLLAAAISLAVGD
jgi:Ca2+-transporting ATPase